MPTRRLMIAALLALGLAPASAQTWPDRPLTFVVPFAAGGTTDISARVIADHMSRTLKQQIIIENVAGAGGSAGATRVKNARADGYTFLVGNLGSQVANVGINPNLQYDPVTDFTHVGMVNTNPLMVVTKKDFPAATLQEFIASLRTNADKLVYGSGGVGATSHLTCLYFLSLVGANVRHVPYRGSGPALNDLMSGTLDFVCDQSTAIVPHAQAGTVKALVVTSPARLPQLPNVPAAAEAGLPAFQVEGWNGIWGPKGVPAEAVTRLQEALRVAHADPGVRKRFEDVAANVPPAPLVTSQGLSDFVKAEVGRWVPVIRAAGVTAN